MTRPLQTLFSGPSVPQTPPAQPAPRRDDAAVEEARRLELARRRNAQGRANTVLTGGAGDVGPAPVRPKVLLGQ